MRPAITFAQHLRLFVSRSAGLRLAIFAILAGLGACGDTDNVHVGTWMLVETAGSTIPGTKPPGFDSTLEISEDRVTLEEVFDGCSVRMIDVSYEQKKRDGEQYFHILSSKADIVRCVPNPCDVVLPLATTSLKCPDSMPVRLLPDHEFKVKDDHLLVSPPYFPLQLLYRRVTMK